MSSLDSHSELLALSSGYSKNVSLLFDAQVVLNGQAADSSSLAADSPRRGSEPIMQQRSPSSKMGSFVGVVRHAHSLAALKEGSKRSVDNSEESPTTTRNPG